jgi:hypothetical protein
MERWLNVEIYAGRSFVPSSRIFHKHMIRSCLDLVEIAIDGSTSSDIQYQLRDSPRNQKMTHASMLVQCHQHIGTGSIMLMGYRKSTG